jgi:hypothetical protein
MSLLTREDYLSSPKLLLVQQRRRLARQLHFSIANVEPRAKHPMSNEDKDEIQEQLLNQLTSQNRRESRGPLALSLIVSTTEKTPTQAHRIAKNLLDLFGKPRPHLTTGRRALLYGCDQLSDFSALTDLTSLQTLNFSRCGQLRDLSSLIGPTSLHWLAYEPFLQ